MGQCVLCGKDFERTISHPKYCRPVYIYLERGISKNHFLCPECYDAKIKVCNYGCSSEEQSKSTNLLLGHIADKSDLIQNIVKSWIDGEEKCYYTDIKDLVYYVPGPVESLFVFKNHLTILSAYYDWSNGAPWDYVIFYGNKNESKESYYVEIERNRNPDIKTLKGEDFENCSNKHHDIVLELNASLGESGSLSFSSDHFGPRFSFYYHQNQLMEEVYNYIINRMENPDAEDEEVVQTISNIQKTAENQVEKKEEALVVTYSPADEIRKMKELLDCGILSQEEFERAKNRMIDKL